MPAPSLFDEKLRAANGGRGTVALVALAGMLASVIFSVDLLLPLGVAGGVPYAGMVLIGLWSRWRPLIIVLAVLGSVLTVLGYLYSPAGGEPWVVITNRGLAIAIIWVAAIMALQRKRWEAKLRHSEAQMRLVTDALPVLIAYIDAGRRFRFVNKTAEAWFAMPRADIIGRSIAEVVGEAQAERTEPVFERIERGETIELEFAETYPDGVARIVKMDLVPDFDAGGEVRGHFALFQDITQRKRAETALRHSEAQFRLLSDNLPVLVASLDSEFRYRFANRAYREWFGVSDRDIVGKHMRAVLGQAAYRHLQPRLEAALDGKNVSFEASIKRGDGAARILAASYIPDRDEAGVVQGLFLLADDITERKKAEEALRRSEASLANAQRIAHIGSWEWGIVAGDLHWSDEIYRIFGLKPQEFGATYEAFLDTIHPDDRTAVDEAVNTALDGHVPYSIDHRIVLASGEVRVVHEQAEVERDAVGKPVTMRGTVQDITERRRAEAALKESEETLNAFFSNAPVGMALYDREIRYLKINKQLAWDTGLSVGEHVGKSIAEIKPELAKVLEPIYREMFESGETKLLPEVHGEMPSDPGVEHWWTGFAFPTSWVDGKPSKIGVVALDITERRRIEEEVRATAENLDAMLKASPLAIYTADLEGKLLNWNPASEATFGWREDEVLGKLNPTIPKNERGLHLQSLAKTAGGMALRGKEFRRLRKDGTLIDIAVWTAPLRDASDRIVGVMGVFEDITERKRINAALLESEARLDAFFTNAPIGLAIFDDQNRFLKINDVMAGWNGVACEDHVGMTVAEMFPAYKRLSEASFLHIMKTGKPVLDQEFVGAAAARPDHEMTWLINRFPIPGVTGKPVGVGSIAVEISEQKRTEEEIRNLNADLEQRVEKRTAELRTAQSELVRKERLATLGQLSATVSHELRNPLGTIRNSLVVLEKKLGGNDPGVQRSIDRMVRNIGRCNSIIDEMLDFARARPLELKKTAFDAWLGSVLDELQVPPGVSVGRKFGAPKARLGIDDDRMRRAIVNVYDNACQAMIEEPDGKGRVRKKKLTVSTKTTRGRLELAITDTGPGMPPEVLAAAFEPLYSTKGFGVGLGLPIVKQIMEQHGGNIEITSKLGSGTRVVLWLPLGKAAAKTKKGAK